MGETPEQRRIGHESAIFSFWRDASPPFLPLKDSTKELKSKKPCFVGKEVLLARETF